MARALDENSVIVAHVMPLYGNDIEAGKIN
jgi:hypothetical protein